MKLSEHCYAATGLGYTRPWSVNAGFIVGKEVTIVVDAGPSSLAAATIHGYASAVRPSNSLMLINTEPHFDHLGGNGYFADREVRIYGHSGIERTEEEWAGERAEFAAVNGAEAAAAFYSGSRLANPTIGLMDEALFDPGGVQVEVLFTPGHTPQNISVWVPADRVLYAGDCLVNGYLPNLSAGGPPEWRQWIASLDRIERLKPLAVVAGHGPVARGEEVGRTIEALRQTLRAAI